MVRLKNLSGNTIKMIITECPFSNPMKSPEPNMVRDPKDPRKKIPNPSLVCKADEVIIRKGETMEFGEGKEYNEEQAAWLYYQLGSPEDGGVDASGRRVVNKNFLIEVDEKGVEVKDNLFKKYRITTGPSDVFTRTATASQFMMDEPKQ